MKKFAEIKLDIHAAVEMGTAMIHSGVGAFCLDTEFGRIPVEVRGEKYTMYNSSSVKWKSAPASNWVVQNRNADYQWYVTILKVPGQSRVITKMQLIRELSAVMFGSIACHLPGQEDLTALTNIYLDTYTEYVNSVKLKDAFRNEYVKLVGGVKGMLPSTREVIRNEVKRAMKTEEMVTKLIQFETNKSLQERGLTTCDFHNDFYRAVAGLILTFRLDKSNKMEEYKAIMEDGDGEISAYTLINKLLRI